MPSASLMSLSLDSLISEMKALNISIMHNTERIRQELSKQHILYIVLDDDPTGTQCCNDVYVYTKWSNAEIHQMFDDSDHSMAFILTNSRALQKEESTALHESLLQKIIAESEKQSREFRILSRSDSTLRWNYPCEMDAILKQMKEADIETGAEVICPCFVEGGRLTRGHVHYAVTRDEWIPVGETEFAEDQSFSFSASKLDDYIREKRSEKIPASRFVYIEEEELKQESDSVLTKLMTSRADQYVIVSATDYEQLSFFALQYITACGNGKNLIYRGASSLLRFWMKQPFTDLIGHTQFESASEHTCGGLIVAGSHVKKTARQLNEISPLCETVTFHQSVLLDENAASAEQEMKRCTETIDMALSRGKTVCFMTDRCRIDLPGADEKEQLTLTARISEAFLSSVYAITSSPAYVIGKGGITSCQLGEMLLNDSRVLVKGQIEPGISVWQLGDRAKYPGMLYVIFPGNVGAPDTLKKIIEKLEHRGSIDR